MKKIIVALCALSLVGLLAACGSSGSQGASQSSAAPEASQSSEVQNNEVQNNEVQNNEVQSSAPQSSAAQSASSHAANTQASSSPYAWLGLQDMPQCNYLDILATYHYIQTSDMYSAGVPNETIKAVDGINSYMESAGTRLWSVDGRVVSMNDESKIYSEDDVSSLAQDAQARLDEAQKSGSNMIGREFAGTGKGAIPEYGNAADTAEYDYYEYTYPEAAELGSDMLERFYMKDGDVYAIYQKTTMGETVFETVEVIKGMSGDIPEGTFDIPSTEGYEKVS